MAKAVKKEQKTTAKNKPKTSAKSRSAVPPKKTKKESKAEQQLKEALTKNEELNDKFLRLYSEFDNYRKRTLKERTELLKSASEEVITQLLPVLDDFERALNALADQKKEETAASMHEGIQLIYNKLKSILTQKGLAPIDSMGQEFDVDFHEALTNIPAPSEDMKGKVVDEIEKGYKLGDKVIRYAKVVVGN